jgi:biopolymer transport protein ExbB/TolQ
MKITKQVPNFLRFVKNTPKPSSFGLQVFFIVLGAFLMTRLLMEVVEIGFFKWDDTAAQTNFTEILVKKCQNLQLDGNVHGDYVYNKTKDTRFSLVVSSDSILVKMDADTFHASYTIATSERNMILGYRTTNTGEKDVEANILNLGAKLKALDVEVEMKEKKGIRWLQAVLEAVKESVRLTSFFNGSIQFYIYLFSMIIVAFLIIDFQFLIRNKQQLAENTFLASQNPVLSRKELSGQLSKVNEDIRRAEYHPEIEPNIMLNLLKHSLEVLLTYESEINKGEVLANIEAYGQGLQERLERRFQIIRYFLNAIPSLGFIGTVWGISEALTITSKLTGESLPYERMVANGTLGQSLNFAFDTTLVGLVASIILSFFTDWLENRELSFVIDARHKILNRLSIIHKII